MHDDINDKQYNVEKPSGEPHLQDDDKRHLGQQKGHEQSYHTLNNDKFMTSITRTSPFCVTHFDHDVEYSPRGFRFRNASTTPTSPTSTTSSCIDRCLDDQCYHKTYEDQAAQLHVATCERHSGDDHIDDKHPFCEQPPQIDEVYRLSEHLLYQSGGSRGGIDDRIEYVYEAIADHFGSEVFDTEEALAKWMHFLLERERHRVQLVSESENM